MFLLIDHILLVILPQKFDILTAFLLKMWRPYRVWYESVSANQISAKKSEVSALEFSENFGGNFWNPYYSPIFVKKAKGFLQIIGLLAGRNTSAIRPANFLFSIFSTTAMKTRHSTHIRVLYDIHILLCPLIWQRCRANTRLEIEISASSHLSPLSE